LFVGQSEQTLEEVVKSIKHVFLFCPVKEELVKVLFTTQIAWTLYNKGKKDIGSIPLDPSVTQSLEDGQTFIDLFPNSHIDMKCSKRNHFQTVTNGKQWGSVIEGTSTFLKKMVVE